MARISPLDLLAPGALAILTFALGAVRKRKSDAAEFLIMGRTLSAPAFVLSIVCSWYGGILGVSEYSYRFGLSNWFVFGIPYYLHALLFAIFFARRARRSGLMSLPDRFEHVYGAKAARVAALVIFLSAMPAAYLMMLGKLGAWLLDWPYWLALLAGTALSTLYIFTGGLRGVVRTDLLQFGVMYAGFFVMVGFLFAGYGGLPFIRATVAPELLSPTGGQALSAIVVWYFIASTALVEPLFYERAYAMKSERAILPSMIVAILFWALFDFLTTTTGLYARALLPSLADPVFAFPELALRVLPAGFFGLFLAALLATVASTIDAYTLIAGAALGRDFLSRGKPHTDNVIKRNVQIGIAIATACAFLLALFSDSIITLWHAVGSITAPALLLPAILAWYSKHPPSSNRVVTSMLASGCTALIWRLSPFVTSDGSYWFSIEPVFVGLALSAVILFTPRSQP
ncbi:sodium:solute symporter family protein [bacterium]|nr:sodium:solute symporter family protein [bacterium]